MPIRDLKAATILTFAIAACGGPPQTPTAVEPPTPHPVPATAAPATAAPTAPPSTPAPSSQAEPPKPAEQTYIATALKTGKWPEGLALTATHAWVAVSGERHLARINLTTGLQDTKTPAGRLPVEMTTADDGTIYGLSHTDATVWQLPKGGNQAKPLAKIPGCPEGMARSGDVLWVLSWPDCSSAASTLTRVDRRTGATKTTATLRGDAFTVAAAGDTAWVVHARDGGVTAVSAETVAETGRLEGPPNAMEALFLDGRLYVAAGPRVHRLYPGGTRPAGATLDLGARVAVLGAKGNAPAAALEDGRVVLLDPGSLEVTVTIRPDEPIRDPHALVFQGETAFLTTHHASNEGPGTLWRLEPLPPPPEPPYRPNEADPSQAPIPALSVGPLREGMSQAEVRAHLGQPFQVTPPQEEGATGDWVTEWGYPKQGVRIWFSAGSRKGPAKLRNASCEAPCAWKTPHGVRVGTPASLAWERYQAWLFPYEEPPPRPAAEATGSFVAGSPYGGMFVDYELGKVSRLFFGPGAE